MGAELVSITSHVVHSEVIHVNMITVNHLLVMCCYMMFTVLGTQNQRSSTINNNFISQTSSSPEDQTWTTQPINITEEDGMFKGVTSFSQNFTEETEEVDVISERKGTKHI